MLNFILLLGSAGFLFEYGYSTWGQDFVIMVIAIGFIHMILFRGVKPLMPMDELDVEKELKKPKYKIMAGSNKLAARINGKDIPQFLIMSNKDVYEYDRWEDPTSDPKLDEGEILLDEGQIYLLTELNIENVQTKMFEDMMEYYEIDDLDEIEDLTAKIKEWEKIVGFPDKKGENEE